MTAFDPATDLPTSVNSLERLAAWANGALYDLHKNSRYQESDASPLVPVITAQDGLGADEKEHIIYRLSLTVADNWRTNTTPYWVDVQDLSNAAIPPGFLP